MRPSCEVIAIPGGGPTGLELADWIFRPPLAYRVGQPDAVTINGPQRAGSCQKAVRSVLVGHKPAKQPGSFRQLGEQGMIVTHQPAIEGPIGFAGY